MRKYAVMGLDECCTLAIAVDMFVWIGPACCYSATNLLPVTAC
jgi:hypothetical protein